VEIIVSIIMLAGSLLAIASGIWVAFVLGSAISTHRKKNVHLDPGSETGKK
jgi:hypothetical protein